ncbi:hypothetical protein [Kordia sp.]|uniref:hypothetical protein n=1 Tax=Kordia sp. TaxID=1965332 RepID=UPI003D2905C4
MSNYSLIIPGEKIPHYDIDHKKKFFMFRKGEHTLPVSMRPNLKVVTPAEEQDIFSVKTLIAPTAFSMHHPDVSYEGENFLNVKVFTFLKIALGGDYVFNVSYQLVLNASGNYQINIYISFNRLNYSSEESTPFEHYEFDIIFKENSISLISNSDVSSLDLKNVETVKVFLIRTNPKTSRGTVTTVQRPG